MHLFHTANCYPYYLRKLIPYSNKRSSVFANTGSAKNSGLLHSADRHLLLLFHIQVLLCPVPLMKSVSFVRPQPNSKLHFILLCMKLYCCLLRSKLCKSLIQNILLHSNEDPAFSSLCKVCCTLVFTPAVSAVRMTIDGAHLAADMTQMLNLELSSQLQ